MSVFQLQEPIVKALAAQLAAQLPNAISTINGNVNDGFTLLNPNNVYDHMPLLSTIAGAGFPAVAIEDMGSLIEDDLVTSVTGVHRLAIVAFVANPDPEALAWQLRRYQQAIMNAIPANRVLGSAATNWTIRFVAIEPGPMLGPSDKPNTSGDGSYVSWVAVEIECPRTEV